MVTNQMLVFQAIKKYHHATMTELVRESGLSSPVVKLILEEMEAKGYVEKQIMNTSSKGRNANVYSLHNDKFMVLGLFIDEHTVDISIRDALSNTHYENHLYLKETKELEDFIVKLVERFHVTCVSVAAAGIVDGLFFYRDQKGTLTQFGICDQLNKRLSIPVIIQNDVKTMMMGYVSNSTVQDLAYVYFSTIGVGSSYCIDKKIIQGVHHYSGELGMIPLHGKKINEIIQSGAVNQEMKDIITQVITIISVTIDPKRIVIAGKNIPFHLEKEIKESSKSYLGDRYALQLEFRNVPLHDVMEGVHYLGIERLFEEYIKQGEKA